jgi:hypothetical protein
MAKAAPLFQEWLFYRHLDMVPYIFCSLAAEYKGMSRRHHHHHHQGRAVASPSLTLPAVVYRLVLIRLYGHYIDSKRPGPHAAVD